MAMRRFTLPVFITLIGISAVLGAQQPAPDAGSRRPSFQEDASSNIRYYHKGDDAIVEIRNISYEVTGTQIPGRPPEERLVLRKTVRSTEILGEIGVDATTTVEARRLGSDLKQKPLYRIELGGTESRTMDNALLVVSRGLEEVDWWSVHKLGTGEHLFDTYVPLLSFSISRENLVTRYVGLEVPPDDATDSRLREPHVVAVLTYASGRGVLREALVTADSPAQAQSLRSYSDERRSMSITGGPPDAKPGEPAKDPGLSVNISFSQNHPLPGATVTVVVPIARDDLGLAHAQLPPGLHIARWMR
jgi:hypothetical protein